jgi:hypothetical protein
MSQYLAPISPRQLEIQEHQVGTRAAPRVNIVDELDGALAICEHRQLAVHAVLAERFSYQPDIGWIVLHHDNPRPFYALAPEFLSILGA